MRARILSKQRCFRMEKAIFRVHLFRPDHQKLGHSRPTVAGATVFAMIIVSFGIAFTEMLYIFSRALGFYPNAQIYRLAPGIALPSGVDVFSVGLTVAATLASVGSAFWLMARLAAAERTSPLAGVSKSFWSNPFYRIGCLMLIYVIVCTIVSFNIKQCR